MDLCLFALNHNVPSSDVAAAIGLTVDQVERIFVDIQAKRRATLPLHLPPQLSGEVKEIGKDKVTIDYIARGDQDPHFVEVLPSYMVKLRNADILFKIGMGLEMWANQLVDGSRNDQLLIVDLSIDIDKKEVLNFKPDASYGDVHPFGNPHYWLDPENAKIMAKEIYENLSSKDNDNARGW